MPAYAPLLFHSHTGSDAAQVVSREQQLALERERREKLKQDQERAEQEKKEREEKERKQRDDSSQTDATAQ
jgi:hypothetical protein